MRTEVDSEIVQCPSEVTQSADCFLDTTWANLTGWGTQLTSHFRRATIAYSRLNGSIVSWKFTSPNLDPAPIDAQMMLQAYRDAYGSFTTLADVLSLWNNQSSTDRFPIFAFPALVASSLKSIDKLGLQNPAVQNRAAANLQCLLAIMIYYAQPSLFAKYLAQLDPAGVEPLSSFKRDILAIAPPHTNTTVAVPRYQIVVGKSTLIAYLIIYSIPLTLCFLVLAYITFSSLGSGVPDLTPFPALDAAVRCRDVNNMQLAFGNIALEAAVLNGSRRKLMNRVSKINLTAR
jgi:hypothetical protein